MKSKKRRLRRVEQARSAVHQRAVLELRRSNAASPHTKVITRQESKRRAVKDQDMLGS